MANEPIELMKQVLLLPVETQIHLDTFHDEEKAEEAAALFEGDIPLNMKGQVYPQGDGTFEVWVETKEKDVTPTDLTKMVLSYLTLRSLK